MKHTPLVTITIPTLNSATTLPLCLDAIKNQTYKNIEVILVDGYSSDNTRLIAKKYHVKKIFSCRGALLESRILGINNSNGLFVLLLDSDQIIENTAVERCVKMAKSDGYEMLALGEQVFRCKTFLEWLFYCDREVIETVLDYDPKTSVILPRFFTKSLLKKVISNIPTSIISSVGGPDHAILYWESWKITQRITSIPKAVFHMEPSSLIHFVKKFYRWGKTGITAKTIPEYQDLMSHKERFRKGLFMKGLVIPSIGSILLLILKGVPYKFGYFIGKLQNQ